MKELRSVVWLGETDLRAEKEREKKDSRMHRKAGGGFNQLTGVLVMICKKEETLFNLVPKIN